MPLTLLLGALYGDEGKGRVAAALAGGYAGVTRFNGGANARHTVLHRGQRFALRQVPSGVFHRGVWSLLGPGMLVEPFALREELAQLEAAGIDTRRVYASRAATVVLPLHRDLDGAMEDRRGRDPLGTTRRGIGPALIDKVRRVALHLGDLGDPAAIDAALRARDRWEGAPTHPSTRRKQVRDLLAAGRSLAPRLVDGRVYLGEALGDGARVLVEGAQGALLDLDHGAWPHVTPTHPTSGGALATLGLPPRAVERVIGVTRAYATRQGPGFFPTEVTGFEEGALRAATREHSLRLGWLDLVGLRLAHAIDGFDELIVTGLDRLSGLEHVQLCRAYATAGGELLAALPPRGVGVRPVYEVLPGFTADLSTVTRASALPAEARRVLDRIEAALGVPIRRFSAAREGPLATRRPGRPGRR